MLLNWKTELNGKLLKTFKSCDILIFFPAKFRKFFFHISKLTVGPLLLQLRLQLYMIG